jgi:hypothetical protein
MKRIGALLAIAISIQGCRVNVSLDATDGAPPSDAGMCPLMGIVPTLYPDLGQLRAIAAHAGFVVAAFARPDGSGVVALSSGGPLAWLAGIEADPTAIAFDGVHAYVACRASAQVYRVRINGEVSRVNAQLDVSSITVGADGRAFWTTSDAVVGWDFKGGTPTVAATLSGVQSIAERDGTLYLAGAHSLSVLPRGAATPTRIANVCGRGAIAVERDHVFCIDDGVLQRVDLGTRTVRPLVGGIREGADVVVARGRAFYWSERPDRTTIEAFPIDEIGGPTVVSVVQGRAVLATDGCGLYYSEGREIWRFAL